MSHGQWDFQASHADAPPLQGGSLFVLHKSATLLARLHAALSPERRFTGNVHPALQPPRLRSLALAELGSPESACACSSFLS